MPLFYYIGQSNLLISKRVSISVKIVPIGNESVTVGQFEYRINWEDGFKYLVNYKKEFGDCLVTSSFQSNVYRLGGWISSQWAQKTG